TLNWSLSTAGAFANTSASARHSLGVSSSHTFTRSSGCEVGGTDSSSSSETTPTASRILPSSAVSRSSSSSDNASRASFATWSTSSREIGMVWILSLLEKESGLPEEPARYVDTSSSARCHDVRGLGTLWPLDDLELHTLAFGEGLEAVHRDRGEVDEDVVPSFALDEAVALLVRKPLDGALLHVRSSYN